MSKIPSDAFNPFENDPDPSPVCRYCGKRLSEAYEESMGMYCAMSPTGTHRALDDKTAAPPKESPSDPLDRLYHLIAETDLIRERPQTDDVSMLEKARTIAAIVQAQELRKIRHLLYSQEIARQAYARTKGRAIPG